MRTILLIAVLAFSTITPARAQEKPAQRVYENRLTPIKNAAPLLADHPEYVEPIKTGPRFEAPLLIEYGNVGRADFLALDVEHRLRHRQNVGDFGRADDRC